MRQMGQWRRCSRSSHSAQSTWPWRHWCCSQSLSSCQTGHSIPGMRPGSALQCLERIADEPSEGFRVALVRTAEVLASDESQLMGVVRRNERSLSDQLFRFWMSGWLPT